MKVESMFSQLYFLIVIILYFFAHSKGVEGRCGSGGGRGRDGGGIGGEDKRWHWFRW